MNAEDMNTAGSKVQHAPVRRRLMLPLTVVLVLLVSGAAASLLWQHKHYLDVVVRREITGIPKEFAGAVRQQASVLEAELRVLTREEWLRQALKTRDRDLLLSLGLPYFEQLRQEHGVTLVYFHDPGRANILRLYNPEKTGDRVDRFTLLEAERTRKAASGIELGSMGFFTLRVVQPVFEHGVLIGYLELGKEIEDVLRWLHTQAHVELAVLIHKSFLDRENWEKGMRVVGRDAHWDFHPEKALIYSSLAPFPAEAARFFSDSFSPGNRELEIKAAGKTWRMAFLPNQDASGQMVGDFIIMHDISEQKETFIGLLVLSGAGMLTVLSILLGFFHVVLARTDRVIREREQEIRAAEAERRKLEAQLRQAQKMEAVGRLAGGVAHDFNNKLQTVFGYTDLALKSIGPGEPIRKDLEEIRKAAQHSADLTRQLLAFARKQTISPQVLNFNETIGSMIKMLGRLIGEEIELLWKPGDNLRPVRMDPVQIDQILANLAVNARSAINGMGKIVIETANVELDKAYCEINAGFMPGKYVLLAVSDNGAGMNKEVLANIFEPFFTTKAGGEGTGLGLATVYGIVKQNAGFINVYSEPGKGTTFKIYLPPSRVQVGVIEKIQPRQLEPGTETVLLVEDEDALLSMVKSLLEQLGYSVIAASTPKEALSLARQYPGEIQMLLTDVVMPGMNGRDLYQQMKGLQPQLKCLFMSGYTANIISHHGVLEEGVNFIQKPFSLEEIAARLRELLDQNQGEA